MKKSDVWYQKQIYEKVLVLIIILCGLSMIILASVGVLGIWANVKNIIIPLFVVQMIMSSFLNWNKNKKIAIFNLCVAIFLVIISIYTLIRT